MLANYACVHIQHLKVGDDVILENNLVKPAVMGRGDSATINIPSAFIHPDSSDSSTPPLNPDSPDYGYCLIGFFDIIGKA